MTANKKAIQSPEAPAAIGSYTQAIAVDKTVYLSGQIPLDPITMTLVPGDINVQIHQVFHNLSAVCKAAGGSLDEIVKLTVYLVDLAHLAIVNEIMQDHFALPYPARTSIQISALPKGAGVEIDAILVL